MSNRVTITITQSGRTPAEVSLDLVAATNFAIKGVAEHFGNRAILNASIDLTPLRRSIKAKVLKKATVRSPVAKAEVSAATPYALKVHEEHLPAQGPYTRGGPFNKGQRTLAQPGTVEGGAGGAFFKRVADFRFEQYTKFVAAFADAAMKNTNLPAKLPDA